VNQAWGWLWLGMLGAYHGANPGMGWLFAVALGLQERSGRAVVEALPPIALGHAAAVGLTVAALALGVVTLSPLHLRWLVAILLVGFGLWKLVRPRHPRWVGMRVGFRDLVLWSFLMATAHGAGLMVLPVFLLASAPAAGHEHHGAGLALTSWGGYVAAVGLHTLCMLLVAGAIALVVYHKLGLSLLRQSWFNLDRAWAAALIAAGVLAAL
jgi:hypothetical protein